MNIKVLVISHMYPTLANKNSGNFVKEQVSFLSKKGIEIRVLVPTPYFPGHTNWSKFKNLPFCDTFEGIIRYHIPVFLFPGKILFGFKGDFYSRTLLKHIESIYKDFPFNIIHCHTIYPDGYAGVKLKKELESKKNIVLPLITTIHGSDIMIYPYYSRLGLYKIKNAILKNDKIIVVSKKLGLKMKSFCINKEYTQIPNGYNSSIFYPIDKIIACNRLGIKNNRINILFVGNLVEVKGLKFLIKAFKLLLNKVINTHLYLVGEGKLRFFLEKLSNELSLQSYITFVGSVEHKSVPVWINSSDLVVLPSLSEGLPTILLEAMACGKPLIGSDVGGVSELINNNNNGFLVPSKDINILCEAMSKILLNKDLRIEMGSNSLKKSKSFTWENNALKTINLYKNILKGLKDTK